MSELVWGDVDWNTADSGSSGKTEFMRLTEGDNVIRIMANPIQLYVNWVTLPDGTNKRINTPEDDDLARKLEDAGFKRQTNWMLKVLDRSDNQFKLLTISRQIFDAIKALAAHKKWGKVTGYDLTVTRGPKGKQPLYRVQPDPHEPLDSSLKESFMKFSESLNIERLISPSDTKYVCEIMGWKVPTAKAEESEADPFSSSEEGEGDTEYNFE